MLRLVLLPQVGLNEKIQANGGQVPKKVITAPFVQIPLGITEDRLVGTVDIEASMKVPQHFSFHDNDIHRSLCNVTCKLAPLLYEQQEQMYLQSGGCAARCLRC